MSPFLKKRKYGVGPPAVNTVKMKGGSRPFIKCRFSLLRKLLPSLVYPCFFRAIKEGKGPKKTTLGNKDVCIRLRNPGGFRDFSRVHCSRTDFPGKQGNNFSAERARKRGGLSARERKIRLFSVPLTARKKPRGSDFSASFPCRWVGRARRER